MNKPCENCRINIEQAILYDEVDCYLTCEKFKEWKKKEVGKRYE